MKYRLPDGLSIRAERPEDYDGIRHANRSAFNGDYEADVVDRIRENCGQILSLVARQAEQVIGHILFSPVQIVQHDGKLVNGMGLGPLAVLPGHQGKGIGSALSQEGMLRMVQAGHPFVIVLGHPTYYPRFGFSKASTYGITSTFEGVPEEAFMIAILDEARMKDVAGKAYYRAEFGSTA